MDFFDQLPEIAFLRIFDYLPLKDRFSVGRVSQSFRRISLDVNSRIKSLDLNDPMFKRPDMEDQLGGILRLCQHNLREIKFRNGFGLLVSIFSEFTCPQLINLDLGMNPFAAAEFARIITNHPNLKSLKWASDRKQGCVDPWFMTLAEFPPVTLSNLETLVIHKMDDATLERLVDRCPNLKNVEMTLRRASSVDILDRFFRAVPRLESLHLNLKNCRIRIENLVWFWRLPLTSLTIEYLGTIIHEFMINDDFIYKLIEHFKNIEHLDLEVLTNVSDDAVAALARLEKLRVAKLDVTNTEFTDVTIREFSACRQLEELLIYCIPISDHTVLELFRNCPRLSKLYVCGMNDDDVGGAIDAETAGLLLLELSNVPHRPTITIEITCHNISYQEGMELQSVWQSIQVRNAVQHLRETHGMEINIRLEDMPPPPPAVEGLVQGDDLEVENGNQPDVGQMDDGQMDGGQADGHQPDA